MLTIIAHLFAGIYNCFNCNRGGDAKLVMIKFSKTPIVVSILLFDAYRLGGFGLEPIYFEFTLIVFVLIEHQSLVVFLKHKQ